jgi:ribonuclease E
MEPVKMKAPMPQVNSDSAAHEDADEADATEHEFHEVANVEEVDEAPEEVAEKPAGRRRRRAVSSGIITA